MSTADMNDRCVIRVEHLGKEYRIRHDAVRQQYATLREAIGERIGRLWRADSWRGAGIERFRALDDVSFGIEQGEVVGVLGRNGAGKSTLLKVLSRITDPSQGRVRIRGRVASLLEVGTGFHPELTGRENIFLNGAILGMSRSEVRRKFDEIVAFAEVERFLDTPVKRYSSGMYVRLAFAVAAHLEPEILIVDEVLAVGDAEFQAKCLGKMHTVSRDGRTVLFVSHNMLAVQRLCTRALLLERGRLAASGDVADIVARHLSGGPLRDYSNAPSDEVPRITAARLLTASPRTDRALDVQVEWHLPSRVHCVKVGVGFNTLEGQRIFDSTPEDAGRPIPDAPGTYRAIFRVPPHTFLARHYVVSVGLWRTPSGGRSIVYDHQAAALRVAVDAAPVGPYAHQATRDGLVHVDDCAWRVMKLEPQATEPQADVVGR